jgi:hypothetical protein
MNRDIKAARNFAWKHFELHAGHRLEMFKAYVAFVAISYAGFAAALQAKAYVIDLALSILAILLSIVFLLFDLRIRQLIKISERYLLDDELLLSDALQNQNIRLFRKSDLITHIGYQGFKLTYSNLFRGIYYSNVILGFLLAIASIVLWEI